MIRDCFLAGFASFAMLVCGCSAGGDASVPSGLTIVVQYKQQPLADLHLQLFEQVGGPPVMEGWTGSDGTAELRIPSGSDFSPPDGTAEFVVVANPLSDGGWMIAPKYLSPSSDELKVTFEAGQKQTLLELPEDAVKRL